MNYDLEDTPDEILIQLLVNAPLSEFNTLCRSSKKFNNLCNNSQISERIFEERSYKIFDLELINLKPKSMKWQKFYRTIIVYKSKGSLEEIYNYIIEILAQNNDLEAIKLIYDVVKRNPTQQIFTQHLFDAAVSQNLSNLAIWLFETFGFILDPENIVYGDFLKYCVQNNIFGPNILQQIETRLLDLGYQEEQLTEILDFFAEHNIYPIPNQLLLSQFVILEWLITHNIPIPNDTAAIISNHMYVWGIDMFELLDKSGYDIDVVSANNAANRGNIELLEWLYENKSLVPNDQGIEDLLSQIKYNDDSRILYSVLNFLFIKGIHFSENYVPPENRDN